MLLWWCGICYLFVQKGVGAATVIPPSLLLSRFLKVHYHHQRRTVGVNLAPSWGAPGRTQWTSCVDHSRRGDALLWRGLLSHRGQTAFTTGTQGHKGKNCILKGSILSPLPLCWLWVFERIFVARRKVEKKTRRERVGGFNFFNRQGYYSVADAVIHTTSVCPGATTLVLAGKRNFYASFYALIVRVATEQGIVMMNSLSPVPAG